MTTNYAEDPADKLIGIAGRALAKSERRVDRVLKSLGVNPDGGEKALRRLDRAFLAAAAGSGLVKGVSVISPKKMRVPARAFNRASTVGLLSASALYITAQARVRGIATDDPRVQQMMKEALVTSAMLPAGMAMIQGVARFAAKSSGVPTDPRTWIALASGAAMGGYSGKSIGDQIVAAVNDAFENQMFLGDATVVSEVPSDLPSVP